MVDIDFLCKTQHLTLEHNPRKWFCRNCGQTFINRQQIVFHYETIVTSKNYKKLIKDTIKRDKDV